MDGEPTTRVFTIVTYLQEPVSIPVDEMSPPRAGVYGGPGVELFRKGSLVGRVQGLPMLWWFEEPNFDGQRYVIKLRNNVMVKIFADECISEPQPEEPERPEWVFRRNGEIVGRLYGWRSNVQAWWIEPSMSCA